MEMANKYKPDYIGFVFAESPRKVSYDQARELSGLLSEDIVPVGVFVNEHMKLIVDLFKEGIIEMAQLHGDEDENYIKNLKAKSLEETGSEIPVVNAIEITSEDRDYNKRLFEWSDSAADYFILDSGKGSGKTFNWDLIDKDNEFFKHSIFLDLNEKPNFFSRENFESGNSIFIKKLKNTSFIFFHGKNIRTTDIQEILGQGKIYAAILS